MRKQILIEIYLMNKKTKENTAQAIPYEARCKIKTYSHELKSSAFSIFDVELSNLVVENIQRDTMVIGIINRLEKISEFQHFISFANITLQDFIISLNISTFGFFMWEIEYNPSPIYHFINPQSGKSAGILSPPIKITFPASIRLITKQEIDRAVLLLGALFKEDDQNVRKEYIKGMIHIIIGSYDIKFRREAFGNFYRSFEYFVTNRILNVRRITNELREYKKILLELDLGDEMIAEFTRLYKLRSSQVMHAQRKQIEISLDDVFKMKLTLDVIMQKVYEPIWTEGLKQIRIKKNQS